MILDDVQSHPDDRQLSIEEVGITGLRYPIAVWDRERGKQETIAEISMSLPAHLKGTHMSRFIEVLQAASGELSQHTIPRVLTEMQRRLDARRARLHIMFP
jgi:GTP cyclohydrolase I